MVRWAPAASSGSNPREFLAIAKSWVFPPSPSAVAVAHHKSLVNGVFGWFFRTLTHLVSGHFRTARRWGQPPRLVPPPSLTVISATVAALAIFTRSAPALVLVSVVYGLIFPWGLPWRSQVRNWAGARAAILGSILMSATIGVLGFAGVSTLDSSCVAVLAAPLFIACGCVGSNFQPEMTETTTTTKAPNGAWVMDATTVSSPNGARGALHTFLGLPCEGQKIVVTPGIGRDPRDSFRLSAEAWASGLTIVAVGRLRAEALVDGAHGSANRVDTMAQAIIWVNGRLTENDAVLYLADHPRYLP